MIALHAENKAEVLKFRKWTKNPAPDLNLMNVQHEKKTIKFLLESKYCRIVGDSTFLSYQLLGVMLSHR
jgi:hypothetical protein